jgi:hypothetical protein
MRKFKSTIRLSLLCLIGWLQGLELIIFQDCEVHEMPPQADNYTDLDREMLEDLFNQED